jgi:hypothetical protein
MTRIDSAAALAELINAKGIEQKPTPPRQHAAATAIESQPAGFAA